MNEVALFQYDGRQVRTVLRDGEPWFVAADVCGILDIDASLSVNGRRDPETGEWRGGLDEDEKGIANVSTPGGTQQMLIVSEPGLYSLVLRSRKPEAKAFKRWVTHEVIPQIRKTGVYGYKVPANYVEALRALADEVERREKLAAENATLKPKAEIYDMLCDAENALSIGAVAKALHTGRNRLFEFLRDQKILMSNNLPYQRYLEAGYFRVREVPTVRGEVTVNVTQTLVTPKGQEYIARLLRAQEAV